MCLLVLLVALPGLALADAGQLGVVARDAEGRVGLGGLELLLCVIGGGGVGEWPGDRSIWWTIAANTGVHMLTAGQQSTYVRDGHELDGAGARGEGHDCARDLGGLLVVLVLTVLDWSVGKAW